MENAKCQKCSVELTPDTMYHHNAKLCRSCFNVFRVCCGCQQVFPITEFPRADSYRCTRCEALRSRPGVKTCRTCGLTRPAIDYATSARDCPDCHGIKRLCTKCKQVKPVADFHRSSGSGLRRVCRQCVAKKQNDKYHQRPRPCKCCGETKTGFPLNSHVCSDCYGRFRRCPGCKTVKELTAFRKDSANPLGVHGLCRDCMSICDTERRAVRLTTCLHCGESKSRTEFLKDKKVCNACRLVAMQTCYICGISQPLEEFPEHNAKQALGRSKRCRTCLNERGRDQSVSLGGRHAAAKALANRTNREFTISLEEYAEIRCQPCHYCGHPLNRTGSGLDRIDPTGGYTLDNVVPCCRPCNWTKSDFFTYAEMLVIGEAIGRVKSQRSSHESNPSVVDAVTP